MSIPSAAPHEPTLGDVLTEMRLQHLETRTGQAELRAELSSLRLEMNSRLDEVRTRLNTLTDELADFRRDYNYHEHPKPDEPS